MSDRSLPPHPHLEQLRREAKELLAAVGGRALLPWPSASSAGGLLRGHGRLDGVRARLVAGERLHPTVDPTVTAAIRHGHHTPLVDRGKELEPQFFPTSSSTGSVCAWPAAPSLAMSTLATISRRPP
ncbi:MAG: hypothetical protein ACREX8_03680, partial [Gammaproteobacteria bacterium]